MNDKMTIAPIAYIRSDFPSKFGIPRQSGLADSLVAYVIFQPEYKDSQAFRGLSSYSHLWLIWGFSQTTKDGWHATVRPPRLGGNKRVGVFATRSPFRPNPIALSSVKLEKVERDDHVGTILVVRGADLMDGTPIYDIKPYIQTDCHPDAICSFSEKAREHTLDVEISPKIATNFTSPFLQQLTDVLLLDPRPSYHDDPERIYGFHFAGHEVKFTVAEMYLTVVSITPI